MNWYRGKKKKFIGFICLIHSRLFGKFYKQTVIIFIQKDDYFCKYKYILKRDIPSKLFVV